MNAKSLQCYLPRITVKTHSSPSLQSIQKKQTGIIDLLDFLRELIVRRILKILLSRFNKNNWLFLILNCLNVIRSISVSLETIVCIRFLWLTLPTSIRILPLLRYIAFKKKVGIRIISHLSLIAQHLKIQQHMDGMRKLIFYPAQLQQSKRNPIHNLAAECCFSFIDFSKILVIATLLQTPFTGTR